MAEGKTYLNDEELAEFRQILMDRRDIVLGTYKDLLADVQDRNPPDGGGAQSHLPTHPADMALDDELNDANTQMVEHERDLLVEIDDALRRIDDKTYGVCTATGRPIDKARLQARPWTRYSLEYARRVGPSEK